MEEAMIERGKDGLPKHSHIDEVDEKLGTFAFECFLPK